jgi:hypothetical protein
MDEVWMRYRYFLIDTDTASIPTGIDTSIDTLGMDANPGIYSYAG